jgi:hypothetical protein
MQLASDGTLRLSLSDLAKPPRRSESRSSSGSIIVCESNYNALYFEAE